MEIDKHYYVAITGASGSGKSTILRILDRNNYFTMDYDAFSIRVINESKQVHTKLQEFVKDEFLQNGTIDLKTVGAYFDEHIDREMEFEAWYQPFLGNQIKKDVNLSNYQGICFFDVPLLREKGICDLFDEIWYISAKKDLCCKRIQQRNGYSYEKAMYLINRSSDLAEDTLFNVYVIDNNYSIDKLERNVISRAQSIRLFMGNSG